MPAPVYVSQHPLVFEKRNLTDYAAGLPAGRRCDSSS